jgi:integrase
VKLTEDQIRKLTCPPGKKDILVFDEVQRGLALRISATGSKTFLCQYTFGGSKRRVPLGSLTLALARSAAAAILGDVAKGRDPVADRRATAIEAKRKAAHEALTLQALLDQWSALRLADKRASYAGEAVRAIKVAFAKQLTLPANDLDRAAVVRVLDRFTKDGKAAMAARTAAYGRACFQWAIRRSSINSNPFVDLPLKPVVRRERVLTDTELHAIWQATTKASTFHNIVRMLAVTAQRRDEVAEMAWSEISDDLATWTIPASRAKNNQDNIVPLSPQAQAILRAAPRYEGHSLCFPGDRGPFSGWSKSKDRLDKASGVSGWRLHDLRRTAATGLQRLGIRLEITEAILNHTAGSRAEIVGVYQRHNWSDEKRGALNAWGAHVAAIVERREASGNVTAFRFGARK